MPGMPLRYIGNTVDQRNNEIEALVEMPEKHYYVIYVPGVHRIVILICAEFLRITNIYRMQSRQFVVCLNKESLLMAGGFLC